MFLFFYCIVVELELFFFFFNFYGNHGHKVKNGKKNFQVNLKWHLNKSPNSTICVKKKKERERDVIGFLHIQFFELLRPHAVHSTLVCYQKTIIITRRVPCNSPVYIVAAAACIFLSTHSRFLYMSD